MKIGFGGGCHWCTEAVFQSLKGVLAVEQGWIAAIEEKTFAEAVIVHFDPDVIGLAVLIEVHLITHSSTANHSMRNKYRSAVYGFSDQQKIQSQNILTAQQVYFDKPIITNVFSFHAFHASADSWQNYYYKDQSKPFCETHIDPKIQLLLTRFGRYANTQKINNVNLPSE